MPNDPRIEEIQRRLDTEFYVFTETNIEGSDNEYREAHDDILYLLKQNELLRSSKGDVEHNCNLLSEEKQKLLQQNEQQQKEIERLNTVIERNKEHKSLLQGQLQQSREENTRLLSEQEYAKREAIKWNDEAVRLKGLYECERDIAEQVQRDNERLREELERYEERRQTAALEVGKLVVEHDQVKAELNDYRKVMGWIPIIAAMPQYEPEEIIRRIVENSESTLSRYSKERGESQIEREPTT